jgi:hypothetical protein
MINLSSQWMIGTELLQWMKKKKKKKWGEQQERPGLGLGFGSQENDRRYKLYLSGQEKQKSLKVVGPNNQGKEWNMHSFLYLFIFLLSCFLFLKEMKRKNLKRNDIWLLLFQPSMAHESLPI